MYRVNQKGLIASISIKRYNKSKKALMDIPSIRGNPAYTVIATVPIQGRGRAVVDYNIIYIKYKKSNVTTTM